MGYSFWKRYHDDISATLHHHRIAIVAPQYLYLFRFLLTVPINCQFPYY